MSFPLLAAGASRGLVTHLQQRFAAATGVALAPVFAAAGAVRDQVVAGVPGEVVILTAALLDELAGRGLVSRQILPIGLTRTGIAVPVGREAPDIATADALRAALLAADGVYVPDPQISTAGIHFMGVLRALGIEAAVAPRLRPFPTGAAAMRALAGAPEAGAIGCTQITEIVDTPGLAVVGPLPEPHGLATVYACAIRAGAAQPDAARVLVGLLTGHETMALRDAEGFERPA